MSKNYERMSLHRFAGKKDATQKSAPKKKKPRSEMTKEELRKERIEDNLAVRKRRINLLKSVPQIPNWLYARLACGESRRDANPINDKEEAMWNRELYKCVDAMRERNLALYLELHPEEEEGVLPVWDWEYFHQENFK